MDDDLRNRAAAALTDGTIAALPDKHFINGEWHPARSGCTMESFDPGTAEPFATFAAGDTNDVDAAVEAAQAALTGPWSHDLPAGRGRILQRAAGLIRSRANHLAVVESLDCGKPVSEALADVHGAARAFEYYAGAADKLQGASIPLGRNYVAYTVSEPVGVTAHIVPWNFPIATAARSVAPALASGCTAVVKPAEQTPMTALLLAEILQEAGLPDGVCNVVTGRGGDAGAPLAAHPLVRHITFTGSTATGRRVMQAAAQNVSSVTLELGGKSPVVVLADCAIDRAVDGVLAAIYENAGQVCSAGSRLVVEREIHARLVARLVTRARQLTVGHGLRDPQIGAINSREQLEKIAAYVADAKRRGVEIATGGRQVTDPTTGKGWFFEPTVFDKVTPDDRMAQEEIFGPVLSVQVAEDAEEAIALANATRYGLVAGVYTNNVNKALAMARDIDAGQIYINEYFAGGIEVPFGGNKLSGFGREKGLEALRSYSRVKSVVARI